MKCKLLADRSLVDYIGRTRRASIARPSKLVQRQLLRTIILRCVAPVYGILRVYFFHCVGTDQRRALSSTHKEPLHFRRRWTLQGDGVGRVCYVLVRMREKAFLGIVKDEADI